MVDSLLEIEVAYSLLQEELTGDPVDTNYHKLKTDLKVVFPCLPACGRQVCVPAGPGQGQ